MSTSKPTSKCNRCGQEVPVGEGYLLNGSLSEQFAARLERGVEKKKKSARSSKLVELRMKQVLVCSEKCVRRAIDDDEEIAIARRAAAVWWYIRGESDAASDEVYVTRGMLNHDLLDAAEIADDPSLTDVGSVIGSDSELTSQSCRFVFALGGGFDPAEEGIELIDQFKEEHPQLTFENAEVQTESVTAWPEGNHERLRDSIKDFASKWFAEREVSFEPARLLHADYYDDDDTRGYAVVAYLDAQEAVDSPGEVAKSQFDEWIDWVQERKLIVGGCAAALVVLLSVFAFWPSGSDSDARETAKNEESKKTGSSQTKTEEFDESQVPFPKVTIGVVRVYTETPGFVTLVDGEPARDRNGKLLKTPCAVNIRAGSRAITVAKDGHRDITREVVVSDDTELFFSSDQLATGTSNVLAAPFLDAKVGEPIALDSLNSPGNETDPYLTPDGLAIYFAGDRTDGKGIYHASRASIFEPFSEPSLLALTRSGDMPATPSVTADGLFVVYAVPEKARLMALTRENPITDFTDKEPLRYAERGEPIWQSAQILANGLQLYWSEEEDGERRTLTSSRSAKAKKFEESKAVNVPGTHPCLSSNGLRQYVYDGKTLRRARRASLDTPYSNLEAVVDVELANYEELQTRRQYFVTDDEQWMFYADDPAGDADLYMVRIQPGRGWGVRPRGKAIAQRVKQNQVVAKKDDETITFDPAEMAAVADPDKSLLPYAAHRKSLVSLISKRNYAAAKALVRKSLADSKLNDDRQLVQWDQQDLSNVEGFWNDVQAALEALNPGDSIRIGRNRFDFVRAEDDKIVGKGKTKEIERKLSELDTSDLTFLVDRILKDSSEETQTHLAAFLFYDGEGNVRLASARLSKAGAAGSEFREQHGKRLLQLAEQEFARDKFSRGTKLLGQLLADFPGTDAANKATELRERLYSFIKWESRGPRRWQQQDSEYIAGPNRASGSFLQSPEKYQNFDLTLEWKITTTNGQGGVFFRYSGEGELYQNAFKIQLSNDAGRNPDVYSSGALFAVAAPSSNAVKPQDEWNTLSLSVSAEDVVVVINGQRVLQAKATSDDKPLKGFIAIDGSAGGITYRRMLISEK